ncbi:MAG: uracil-DNA glycosylase [Oscillospiraceae bacterium]|nr:uracil-DNA glycosylase [Oscillospiraceae bacterium]
MNEDSWTKLKRDCARCEACELCHGRHNLVFGDGNEGAKIMLIGEGPGEQEDLQGRPFVGPAGKLLDTMLELIDLDRTRVYIANIVKCRPPRNRDPLPEEQKACSAFLARQLALVDPRIVVCLGRIAAQGIMKADLRITREHGVWYEHAGRMYMATYHPSALLRDESKRPEAFEDLVKIRQQIRELCPEVYDSF